VLATTTKLDVRSIRKALESGLKKFDPTAKDSRRMIRDANALGVNWESQIPVTDPGGPRERRGR